MPDTTVSEPLLRSAIKTLYTRIKAAADNASPTDLAELATAANLIAGRMTVIEIEEYGEHRIKEIEIYSNNTVAAINNNVNDSIATMNTARDAAIDAVNKHKTQKVTEATNELNALKTQATNELNALKTQASEVIANVNKSVVLGSDALFFEPAATFLTNQAFI